MTIPNDSSLPVAPIEPIAPQADASAVEPTEQDKPLTRADLKELVVPLIQSQVDKAEYRISANAQAKIDALQLNKDVLNLTDEQVKQRSTEIVINDLASPRASAQAQAPNDQPPAGQDPIYDATMEIFTEAGVAVEEGDPEFATIKAVLDKPRASTAAYLAAVTRATDAKKVRVAAQSESAGARTFSGGPAGPSGDSREGVSAYDMLKRAHQ